MISDRTGTVSCIFQSQTGQESRLIPLLISCKVSISIFYGLQGLVNILYNFVADQHSVSGFA